ncbi:MAG: DsbA family protein [Loktanella sp.]|nr:DsbA family protein [Loktanella sp.]
MRTALALCLALATPAAAQQDMTDAEREDFRAEVRAYLLDNPEVIMEAVGVLEQREQSAQAEADIAMAQENAELLYNDPTSWVGGNPEGDITIVEFLDYRCGYCKQAHPEVTQLIESDGNIRGLDSDAILAQMDSDDVTDVIARNRALGQQLDITGTPTFVVEDQMLRGYVPGAQMAEIVSQIRG